MTVEILFYCKCEMVENIIRYVHNYGGRSRRLAISGINKNKSICLAAGDFGGLTFSTGSGTHYDQIAELLAGDGWEVVLLPGNLCGEKERNFRKKGIHVYNASELGRENAESPEDVWRDSNRHQAGSCIFDAAIQVLIKNFGYKFDLIEFPETGAGGFIPIQAKYSRICDDTRVIVKLHGPSQWQRENRSLTGVTFEDLKLDYMERYAFENADIQASSTRDMLNWARKQGWKVSREASICPDLEEIVAWYNARLMEGVSNDRPKKGLNSSPLAREAAVTVIIPYYNKQKYIISTLEAIYQQTYKRFNIICVNDGSTDPDAVLMLDYIRHRYPEVLILNKENGGPGSALNSALPYVTGKYIMEVDADDIIKKHMLETYVRSMENRQDLAALSCYVMTFRDEDEKQVLDCVNTSKDYMSGSFFRPLGPCLPVLFFENCAGSANSIFSTDALKAIGGWPETRNGAQDWGLWLKLVANGYLLDVVPEVLYYYRQNIVSESQTKTVMGGDEANIETIRTLIEKNPGWFSSSGYGGLHKLVRGTDAQAARIKDLENQIEQMKHGVALQLVSRSLRVAYRLLPSGTRRRNACALGVRGLRVILNEGLGEFRHKATQYIRERYRHPTRAEYLSPDRRPRYNKSGLPAGAESYLKPDNPRLKALEARYAVCHRDVTTPLAWTRDILRPDDIRYFRGDNAYVWQLRGRNMTFSGYSVTTSYIKSIDTLGLLEKLDEDDSFGIFTFTIDGKTVSRDLLDSIGEIYFLQKHLPASSFDNLNILDIGAGYGRLAHRVVKAFPDIGTYYCTDAVATSTFISEYYLAYRGLGDKARVVPLDEIESTLQTHKIDVAINIHSFSECRLEAIEWWISLLEKNRVKYLMIVPNSGDRLQTNDGKDFQTIIEKHGYRLAAKEPNYCDPVARRLAINPAYHYLFELR